MKQEIMNIKLTREDLVLINTALIEAIALNENWLEREEKLKINKTKSVKILIKEYRKMRERIYNTRGF